MLMGRRDETAKKSLFDCRMWSFVTWLYEDVAYLGHGLQRQGFKQEFTLENF